MYPWPSLLLRTSEDDETASAVFFLVCVHHSALFTVANLTCDSRADQLILSSPVRRTLLVTYPVPHRSILVSRK